LKLRVSSKRINDISGRIPPDINFPEKKEADIKSASLFVFNY
jgi:hypothetical protein